MCTSSKTCFLGATPLSIPNGISIGSAVFAQLAADSHNTSQWTSPPPKNCQFAKGSGPQSSRRFLEPTRVHNPNWNVNWTELYYTLYSVPAQETGKDRVKIGWPPVSDVAAVTKPRREAKPRPLKFAGVPQTRQPISAVTGSKFAILWGHVEEILLFHCFFSDCWYMP